MKKKPSKAHEPKKIKVEETENNPENEQKSFFDFNNQLLFSSVITAFGRNNKNDHIEQLINNSLLHLNEFNAEFEAELQKTSMPSEILEMEKKLLNEQEKLNEIRSEKKSK